VPRSRLANLLVATAVGILFLVGLFIHGVGGAVLLLAVAIVLGYLSLHAWSAIHPRGRRVRILVLAVIVAIAVVKLATR
jgi:hypothetical protein